VTPDWALKYLQQARAEAYIDAREALAGVDAVMQGSIPLSEQRSAAYTGAIIHLLIEQLEARVRWVERMEQGFSGKEPDLEQAEQFYSEARGRLLDLLGENQSPVP
jgi:hypothetical protein